MPSVSSVGSVVAFQNGPVGASHRPRPPESAKPSHPVAWEPIQSARNSRPRRSLQFCPRDRLVRQRFARRTRHRIRRRSMYRPGGSPNLPLRPKLAAIRGRRFLDARVRRIARIRPIRRSLTPPCSTCRSFSKCAAYVRYRFKESQEKNRGFGMQENGSPMLCSGGQLTKRDWPQRIAEAAKKNLQERRVSETADYADDADSSHDSAGQFLHVVRDRRPGGGQKRTCPAPGSVPLPLFPPSGSEVFSFTICPGRARTWDLRGARRP